MNKHTTRRQLIQKTSALAWGVATLVQPSLALARGVAMKREKESTEEEISPVEDLMREHGVLDRILLIYDEILWRRLPGGSEFPPEVLSKSADLVRRFIEDYHEKLEEDHLFPRFEQAGKMADLVQVLRTQHRVGRQLTDRIKNLATLQASKVQEEREKLSNASYAC